MAIQDDKFVPESNVIPRAITVGLDAGVTTTITNRVLHLIAPGYEFMLLALALYARDVAATITFAVYVLNGDTLFGGAPTVAAGTSTASKYKSAAFDYFLAGVHWLVAAAEHTWSTNFVVTANKFGGVLIQADNAGALSTKVVATPQAYASAALALAAIPAPDAGKIAVSRVTIAAGGSDFTANTTATTGLLTTHDVTPQAANITGTTPIAGTVVKNAPATFALAHGEEAGVIALVYTTDGSGDVTDGEATVLFRPFPVNGEISRG